MNKEPEKFDSVEAWKHAVIRSSNVIFTNTDFIFIEYHDCIHFSGYVMLNALVASDEDILGLDFDPLKILSTDKLLEWYCNRKNINFLIDIAEDNPDAPDMSILNEFYEYQLNSEPLYRVPMESNVVQIVNFAVLNKICKNIIVYSPFYNPGMEADVQEKFPEVGRLVTGDLEDAIATTIPKDKRGVYIFSDATKVITLQEMGRLEYSNIVVPSQLGYNLAEDGSYIIDFESMSEQYLFKYGYITLI